MQNNIRRPNSLRLTEFDYSLPNAYFVTLVCQDRIDRFGCIVDCLVERNSIGKMVHQYWLDLPNRFPSIQLDEFILMPNHFHGIVILDQSDVGASLVDARIKKPWVGTSPTPTLGDVIGTFKSITTLEYLRGIKTYKWPPIDGKMWQRNYYDRIIRNDREMKAIRKYIADNPINWDQDAEKR